MILHQQQSKNTLENYKEIIKLGQGAFGQVFLFQKVKSREHDPFQQHFNDHKKPESDYFAFKRFKSPDNNATGLDVSVLRQINFSMLANHDHVNSGYEVIYRKTPKRHEVYLVMDFLLDLNTILMDNELLKDKNLKKNICYQILSGIKYLHQNFFIHRDLKPDNIFCSKKGNVKVADFGFTKQFGTPYRAFTSNTCTTSYRSPQVFFGTHYYTQKSDIWAFGCIVAFIFKGQTLFPAQSFTQLQILSRIFYLRGTPTEQTWSHFQKFPSMKIFEKSEQKNLQLQLDVSSQLAQFLESILQLDPKKRPSAEQLLSHRFFKDVKHEPLSVEKLYSQRIKNIIEKKNKHNDNYMQVQN